MLRAMSTEVILREVRDEDLPILYEHQADPIAYTLADFPPRDRDAFMAHWAKILADDSGWHRVIVVDDLVVGNVVCFIRDGLQEVGYWIDRRFWGRGYASLALAKFLQIVPIRPLYANLIKTNIGSRRVLEKSGFTVLREDGGDLLMILEYPGMP
jgi:RimJ/RimL family protein N-acetyltransferase